MGKNEVPRFEPGRRQVLQGLGATGLVAASPGFLAGCAASASNQILVALQILSAIAGALDIWDRVEDWFDEGSPLARRCVLIQDQIARPEGGGFDTLDSSMCWVFPEGAAYAALTADEELADACTVLSFLDEDGQPAVQLLESRATLALCEAIEWMRDNDFLADEIRQAVFPSATTEPMNGRLTPSHRRISYTSASGEPVRITAEDGPTDDVVRVTVDMFLRGEERSVFRNIDRSYQI